MTQSLKTLFNHHFRIPDHYDLRAHHNIAVVGNVNLPQLTQDLPESALYRPRQSNPPGTHKEALSNAPAGLKALYNIAAQDMRANGQDPNNFHMYILYQTGFVEPSDCLRAGFWHFDLMRFLRAKGHRNKMPVVLSYATSNCLPTIYLSRLKNETKLPARQTIANTKAHGKLASQTLLDGHIFIPKPGEVVRYDSLTMHRGAPNDHAKSLHRTFMHIAFSPVP